MDRVSTDSFGVLITVAESAIELKFTVDSTWCTNPHIAKCGTGVYENNVVRVPFVESQASHKKPSPHKPHKKKENSSSRLSHVSRAAAIASLLAVTLFGLIGVRCGKSASR